MYNAGASTLFSQPPLEVIMIQVHRTSGVWTRNALKEMAAAHAECRSTINDMIYFVNVRSTAYASN